MRAFLKQENPKRQLKTATAMTLVGPEDNIVESPGLKVEGLEEPQTDRGDVEDKPAEVAAGVACNHNLEITVGTDPDEEVPGEQKAPAVVASQIQLLHQQSYSLLAMGQVHPFSEDPWTDKRFAQVEAALEY